MPNEDTNVSGPNPQANTDGEGDAGTKPASALTDDVTIEDKPMEGDEGAEGKTEEGAPADRTVPEEYKFEMPKEFSLSEDKKSALTSLFKESKLTQEEADKFVKMAVEHSQDIVTKMTDMWDGQKSQWLDELKADQELGGSNYDATITRAKRALSRFGSDALLDVLAQTGLGNNPAVARFLVAVDRKTSEDMAVMGGPAAKSKRPADVMYADSMPEK
jgi:hypothetical protein